MCVLQERKLESESFGKVEQDVEHFRPKKSTKPWPVLKRLLFTGEVCTIPPNKAPGYHPLAYHLFNYCASCTPCNRALKRNAFPIAGTYDFAGTDPVDLLPNDHFSFTQLGISTNAWKISSNLRGGCARLTVPTGHQHLRAVVTIQFFQLNSIRRKNLILERCRVITALFPQL